MEITQAREIIRSLADGRDPVTADGIQDLVTVIMADVLRAVNPESKGLYPLGE